MLDIITAYITEIDRMLMMLAITNIYFFKIKLLHVFYLK
jgi:hypothetical protein